MKLIVGLGNPGRLYSGNRHNIGFRCLNYLARQHKIPFITKRARARVGEGEICSVKVILAKPQTFMNSSGASVSELVRYCGIDATSLLVIHDDLDLHLGKLRIQQGGSSAGHKGMESIISYIGSSDFTRIRVGIGRPAQTGVLASPESAIISYVLSDFTSSELKVVEQTVTRVTAAIHCMLSEGIAIAMNRYN